MNTITFMPTIGASSEDREVWLNQRAHGITATQVAKLAKGSQADRRAIKVEKLTGKFEDLTGNKYIDRGNAREPVIAAWIEANFDIAPSLNVYAGENLRHLATPDGRSVMFELDRLTSEIKTSKYDMNPKGVKFRASTYGDQMQWQMHVMGGIRVLFVWEQHDDNWPDPTPVHNEPQWAWVERDQKRIDQLVTIADEFLDDLDRSRPDDLAPVGDIRPDLAQLAHDLLIHRNAEAVAKKQKEAVWKLLQAATADLDEYAAKNEEASISVGLVIQPDIDVLDEGKMRERSPRLVSQYEALVARYSVRTARPSKRTLNVTAAKK